MKTFKVFESFNQYIGLPTPLDSDIDIGYYDVSKMGLKSEPVSVAFTASQSKAISLTNQPKP